MKRRPSKFRTKSKSLSIETLEQRNLLANILLISDPAASGNQPDDTALENFIISQGHTLDADSGAFRNSVPTAAQLDDVDVIVFSRVTNSTNYDDGFEAGWNAIDKPIILMNDWVARSNRWGLVNTTSTVENLSAPATYSFPDPNNVFVSGASTQFAISSSNVEIDVFSITASASDLPLGSTIVATANYGGTVRPAIVDIPAGATTFGSNDVLGGRRVLFSMTDYPDKANQDFGDGLSLNVGNILAQIIDEVDPGGGGTGVISSQDYQAEDAALSGGVFPADGNPGSEGGYADYPGDRPATIEWTTDFIPGGNFDISFRYANGGSSDRPLRVVVNGQVVASSLSFGSTSAWDNWQFTGSVNVTLNEGINTIRLESDVTGPNVDFLRLTGDFSVPPTAVTNLVASSVSSTQINLTWDDTPGETGFIVERRETAGGVFTEVARLPVDATAFSDLGLTPSTGYTYRIIADRRGVVSDPSNEDQATTASTTNSPGISVIVPTAGASNVLRDVVISASLITPNGGILASSLNETTVLLYPTADPSATVEGTIQTSGGGDTLQFNPVDNLDPNTSYTFEVTSGVTDPANAPFTPFKLSFATGEDISEADRSVLFERVELNTEAFTSLTFGPDGKLYASKIFGQIVRYDVLPDGTLGPAEEIFSLMAANGGNTRLLLGLEFDPSSTAENLILWATHSSFFDDNRNFQGKLSRLTGPNLETVHDAVINLPRSVRDHATNQLDFGPDGAIYFLQGSNSANGAADSGWGNRDETLLSAALLRFDPTLHDFVTNGPLDAHTEDADPYDPFAPGAALTLYATGIRNAYDLVWHSNGELYVPNNSNGGQGRLPDQPDPSEGELGIRIDGPFTSPQPVAGIDTRFTNDYLYQVEQGGYYGHTNPLRFEYIFDGGNPSSDVDPFEFAVDPNNPSVEGYPVGVQPDRNFRGAAFDFGARISPNGIIEYKYDGFDGALQNKLIVARYSAGDDLIVLDPGGANGEIISSNADFETFDNFVDPLDLVESPNNNGFLYVASLSRGDTVSGTLHLLRPIEEQPVAPQETFYINQGVDAGQTDPLTIALENTTGETVGITASDVSLTGPNASRFGLDTTALPVVLAPGEIVRIGVTYDPNQIVTIDEAGVEIQTGIAATPTLSTTIRGLGHPGFGGNAEPTLAKILELYQIPTDVGFDTNNPLDEDFTPFGDPDGLLGEEVELQLLRKAGAGPVTIEAPLASFGPPNDPDFSIGWYTPGATPDFNYLYNAESIDLGNPDAQSVNVQIELGGVTEFDPGTDAFGIFGEYYPEGVQVTAYSQDELNNFGGNARKHRFWPLRETDGTIVPGAYIVGVEEARNDDFNDNVFIIRNVTSSEVLPGDYNDDGVVNIADYTVWRDSLDQAVTLPNDISPGEVTQNDRSIWVDNFGATRPVSPATLSHPIASPVSVAIQESTPETPTNSVTESNDIAFASFAVVGQESNYSSPAIIEPSSTSLLEETDDDLLLILVEGDNLPSASEQLSDVDLDLEIFGQQEQDEDDSDSTFDTNGWEQIFNS